MLNKDNIRELAYVVRVNAISPMDADRLECAHINGWNCVVGKGEFKAGDLAIYFEIDSKLPEEVPFTEMEFLVSKHYKIKSQKIRGVVSQGLLIPASALGWKNAITEGTDGDDYIIDESEMVDANNYKTYYEGDFLTERLKVTYAVSEDNIRKASSADKYKKMAQRHPKLARTWWWKKLYQSNFGKKLLFLFFGSNRLRDKKFPNKFPYIHITDQERCENMPWILNDNSAYIRTQKCDGSSGTYILERKSFNRFEFYVCSRNVRQRNDSQECFFETNYYWEVAKKYNIEKKLRDFLLKNKELSYVCWQGEICAPNIQKNPHHLTETHFFCFHMIDSSHGKYDIRDAKQIWDDYDMETVPIETELYILPNDFEYFKSTADGLYDASVCEGHNNCAREGYVYYKASDPNFSFKNVSRKYLLKQE